MNILENTRLPYKFIKKKKEDIFFEQQKSFIFGIFSSLFLIVTKSGLIMIIIFVYFLALFNILKHLPIFLIVIVTTNDYFDILFLSFSCCVI